MHYWSTLTAAERGGLAYAMGAGALSSSLASGTCQIAADLPMPCTW
jgi:hypothetical protein